ncbi:MAG: hypothetical protein QW272_08150 [Candidatus Methanomethylicaceae archaeon]
MELVQKKKTLEEAFKELWLKYADYNKVFEELKNIGFTYSYEYVKTLRSRFNLPKKRDIIKSKKCIYCGKNAEITSRRYSPTSILIFLCRKCYDKIHCKRKYEKHRIKILKRRKLQVKNFMIYLGKIECPKCLKHGYLLAHFSKVISTGHIMKPLFKVMHQHYSHGRLYKVLCHIGRNEELENKVPAYLLECNCKKCRIKRGEINESSIKAKENKI